MAEASIDLYTYAKQVIKNEVPMDSIAANHKYLEMAEWMLNDPDNGCFMLLCNERRDFTLFSIVNDKPIKLNLLLRECIENRGILLLADKQPNNCYEIWIRDKETEENFAYYLFGADELIVEV